MSGAYKIVLADMHARKKINFLMKYNMKDDSKEFQISHLFSS